MTDLRRKKFTDDRREGMCGEGVAGGTKSSDGMNGAVHVDGRVVVEFDLEDGAEFDST